MTTGTLTPGRDTVRLATDRRDTTRRDTDEDTDRDTDEAPAAAPAGAAAGTRAAGDTLSLGTAICGNRAIGIDSTGTGTTAAGAAISASIAAPIVPA